MSAPSLPLQFVAFLGESKEGHTSHCPTNIVSKISLTSWRYSLLTIHWRAGKYTNISKVFLGPSLPLPSSCDSCKHEIVLSPRVFWAGSALVCML